MESNEEAHEEVQQPAEKSEPTSMRQKQRRQKKRLYKAICEQMEFYFSDPNLRRDKFLSNLISQNDEGYVDADVFLKFNKIKALTSDVTDIIKAVKSCNMLKVSEDKKMIKRITPIAEKPDVDDCTIYVENMPPHADHEWLKSLFSIYGPVVYISLPRWSSGKPKGFAFIEFNTPDAAQRACEHFGCISIVTGGNQCQHQELQSSQESSSKKRKLEEDPSCKNETAKRPKLEKEEKTAMSGNEETASANEDMKMPGQKDSNMINEENGDQGEGEEKDGKRKKKRKRKKKKKQPEVEQEVETINLRVMHKSEWRKYRNKYLSLKKDMMSKIKQTLSLYKDDYQCDAKNYEEMATDPPPTTKKNILEFVPDVILQITTQEPITDLSDFKQNIRNLGNVAYVDVTEGQNIAHVRCADAESAAQIQAAVANTSNSKVELLKGDEEKAYWEKVQKDREAKFSAKTRHKRQGVQKVLTKAKKVIEAQNKHIHF